MAPVELPKRYVWSWCLAAAICMLVALTARMDDDVVWQLWVARQLNSGFHLYTDISEVNPPLWFWMAQPAIALADLLKLAPVTVYRILIALYGFVGLWLIAGLCEGLRGENRNAWLVSLALAYFGIGWVFFGQREHMVFMASTAYVFMCVRRAENLPVSLRSAVVVGLYAASGIALKHYFSLVVIGLELWLLWQRRGNAGLFIKKIMRPELIILLMAAVLYAGAILWFTPAYLHDTVPLIRLAYQHYDLNTWQLVNQRSFYLMLVVGLLFLTQRRASSTTCYAMTVSMIVFFCIMLLQNKGFYYHYFVMNGLIFALALYQILTRTFMIKMQAVTLPVKSEKLYNNIVLVFMAMIASGIMQQYIVYGVYQVKSSIKYKTDVASLSTTGPMSLLSSRVPMTITASQMAGQSWGQRYYILWTAPIINLDRETQTVSSRNAVATLRQTLVSDLVCQPPDVIFVDTGKGEYPESRTPINYLVFFSRDRRFADLMQHYRYIKSIDDFMVYKKQSFVVAVPNCHPFATDSIFMPRKTIFTGKQ